jgi:hypothetical protein
VRRVFREIGFAVAAWAVPFALSVCLFPIKKSSLPLFDSLMGVVLAASTVLLGVWYLKRVRERVVLRGLLAGIAWMIANWLLDSMMFSSGPMKMSLAQYASDIGAAYFMIPFITWGLAAQTARRELTSA